MESIQDQLLDVMKSFVRIQILDGTYEAVGKLEGSCHQILVFQHNIDMEVIINSRATILSGKTTVPNSSQNKQSSFTFNSIFFPKEFLSISDV